MYIKQTWQNNPPSTATPITAERLDHLETQYDEAIAQVAADIADPDSDIGTELNATSVALIGEESAGSLRVPLDVWEAITLPQPASASEDIAKHAEFIAAVDDDLAGAATKEQIGTSGNDPDTAPIYAYTAGAESAPLALLVGGTHPWELVGVAGARQWFVQFATSTHPALVALRKRLRVAWIPVLVSSKYSRGRLNANGVNINRNFPLNWDTFSDSGEGLENDKGSAALSEIESQVVKAFIDSRPVACVIDCHTAASSSVTTGGTPTYVHAGRDVSESARQVLKALYDPADEYDVEPYADTAVSPSPTLKNWATKYMRWDIGRSNATGVIVEVNESLAGTGRFAVNREAVRMYAATIHTFLVEWLLTGQQESTPRSFTYIAHDTRPSSSGGDISIGGGGRLINSSSFAPVVFNNGDIDGGSANWLGFAVPTPGRYMIHYDLALEAVTGTPEVIARLYYDPFKRTGDATQGLFRSDRRVTISEGGRATLAGWQELDITTVPEANFFMVQLHVRVADFNAPARLLGSVGAHLRIEHTPSYPGFRRPRPTRIPT